MKTTYIKLFAGLGNQLFQYSYGKYLEQGGSHVRFILKKTYDKNGNCFDLPKIFSVDESSIIQPKTKLSLIAQKIFAKYIMRNWHTGFYQEYRYPASLPFGTFTFKKTDLYTKTDICTRISDCNSVSLHIRGGDYLEKTTQDEFGGICTTEYYRNALSFMHNTIQNIHIFVFTNDMTYAKTILGNIGQDNNCTYVQQSMFSDDPGFDLFLMSQCKHNIIANSTYSWWGSFLNSNKNKIVIAPQKWNNNIGFDAHILLADDWIKIKG